MATNAPKVNPPSTSALSTQTEAGGPDEKELEGHVELVIDNPLLLKATVCSDPITIHNVTWHLLSVPKPVTTDGKTEPWLGVYVRCTPEAVYDDDWACTASVAITICNKKRPLIRRNTHAYTRTEREWGYSTYLKLAILRDEQEDFIIDGKLKITADIRARPVRSEKTREMFVAELEKWFQIAQTHIANERYDLASQANDQGIAWNKGRDPEMQGRLELQQKQIIQLSLEQGIERIQQTSVTGGKSDRAAVRAAIGTPRCLEPCCHKKATANAQLKRNALRHKKPGQTEKPPSATTRQETLPATPTGPPPIPKLAIKITGDTTATISATQLGALRERDEPATHSKAQKHEEKTPQTPGCDCCQSLDGAESLGDDREEALITMSECSYEDEETLEAPDVLQEIQCQLVDLLSQIEEFYLESPMRQTFGYLYSSDAFQRGLSERQKLKPAIETRSDQAANEAGRPSPAETSLRGCMEVEEGIADALVVTNLLISEVISLNTAAYDNPACTYNDVEEALEAYLAAKKRLEEEKSKLDKLRFRFNEVIENIREKNRHGCRLAKLIADEEAEIHRYLDLLFDSTQKVKSLMKDLEQARKKHSEELKTIKAEHNFRTSKLDEAKAAIEELEKQSASLAVDSHKKLTALAKKHQNAQQKTREMQQKCARNNDALAETLAALKQVGPRVQRAQLSSLKVQLESMVSLQENRCAAATEELVRLLEYERTVRDSDFRGLDWKPYLDKSVSDWRAYVERLEQALAKLKHEGEQLLVKAETSTVSLDMCASLEPQDLPRRPATFRPPLHLVNDNSIDTTRKSIQAQKLTAGLQQAYTPSPDSSPLPGEWMQPPGPGYPRVPLTSQWTQPLGPGYPRVLSPLPTPTPEVQQDENRNIVPSAAFGPIGPPPKKPQ
ncbi:unnamed protein product, partial [Mesorhabditis spiculigera]